jgi:hypothetical protein
MAADVTVNNLGHDVPTDVVNGCGVVVGCVLRRLP